MNLLPSLVALALFATASSTHPPPPPHQERQATAQAPQDRPAARDQVSEELDLIEAAALQIARRTRSDEVRQLAADMRASVDRVREVLRGRPTQPPPTDPGTRPPPTDPGTRPPPTDPGTRPPPTQPPPANGTWVDPSTLGHLPPLQPAPGLPATGALEWGPELQKYPAVLDSVFFTAQAKGSPVIPCLVQGVHQGLLRWSRFALYGAPQADGVVRTRWGARWFDVRGFVLSDFVVHTIPDEHGLYWNTVGGFKLERGLFLNIGSQALQVAGAKPGTARWNETGLGDAWQSTVDAHAWDWQELVDCAALECGQPTGGRPSYAVSFFEDVPNPVRLERCLIQTTTAWHPDTSGKPCDSFGAVMAHERLRFELLECGLLYAQGDRDTVQLWGIGDGDPSTVDLRLRGSEIDGRGVDIRVASPTSCQIVIEGCWGTAPVTVSVAPFAPVPVQPSQVIYSGPVSKDWSNAPQ